MQNYPILVRLSVCLFHHNCHLWSGERTCAPLPVWREQPGSHGKKKVLVAVVDAEQCSSAIQ